MPYKNPKQYRDYQRLYKRGMRAMKKESQPLAQPQDRVTKGLLTLHATLGQLRQSVPGGQSWECRAGRLVAECLSQVAGLLEELATLKAGQEDDPGKAKA